jgi:hypothetical protein
MYHAFMTWYLVPVQYSVQPASVRVPPKWYFAGIVPVQYRYLLRSALPLVEMNDALWYFIVVLLVLYRTENTHDSYHSRGINTSAVQINELLRPPKACTPSSKIFPLIVRSIGIRITKWMVDTYLCP